MSESAAFEVARYVAAKAVWSREHGYDLARAVEAVWDLGVQHGHDQAGRNITEFANAGRQILHTAGTDDPLLAAKLDALDEAAIIARRRKA